MYSLLFLTVTSFALASVFTPGVRDLFNWLGVVDFPDSARKFHDRPIPCVGGVAIVLAFGSSVSLLLFTPLPGGWIILQSSALIGMVMPAAALVFFLGLLDDLVLVKPWHKLTGQIVAALLAFSAGVRVSGMGGAHFSWWLSLPVTILWLVGCCNAINLIDGVDGLAAGVSLVATVTMLVAAIIQHNVAIALATVPLAGCLIGFLRYNYRSASIFLGDCGSLFIGFLLGCLGVLWSEKSTTFIGMTAPLIALALPLADTGLAILRRYLRREPIFKGDRGHIHHRLLDLDLAPHKVTLILCGVCAMAGIFSLCMAYERVALPVLLLFCAIAAIGVQRLRYLEFDVVGRLFVQGSFRRLISSQIALRDLKARLTAANTADEFWQAIRDSYDDFGLEQIQMRIAGQTYSSRLADCTSLITWRAIIPLAGGDFAELTRSIRMAGDHPGNAFIEIILETLEWKRPVFLEQAVSAEPYYARAAAAGD